MPNASEDVEHLGLSRIAGGDGDGTASLENILTVSYKIKHILTYHMTQQFHC